MKELRVGDVVYYNEKLMIVVACENHENIGSCSYDRKYLICEKDYINNNQNTIYSKDDIEKHGYWIEIHGMEFPDFERADVAPYEVTEIPSFSFREKKRKTITMYE